MTKTMGFTLIELLIVVATIGILAAIAIPNFLQAQVRAKVSRCMADMKSVSLAMEQYQIDNNAYPNPWPEFALVGSRSKSTGSRRLFL